MKKKLLKFLFTGLFGLLLSSHSVSVWADDDYCFLKPSCGEGPLKARSLSFALKGGIQPAHYTNKGAIWLTPRIGNTYSSSHIPQFLKQFGLPWVTGGEFAFNATGHVQFFFELTHQHAEGRHPRTNTGSVVIGTRFKAYRADSLYLGTRYYFNAVWADECYGNIAPFLGFKGGVSWQHRVGVKRSIGRLQYEYAPYFRKQAAVSAGFQGGIEWFLDENVSFTLTTEVVATQGFRSNPYFKTKRSFKLSDGTKVRNTTGIRVTSVGQTGKLVSFPVTLAVRYTF